MSINGTSFPKDAILTVFPYANHLDESIFPDARRFLPERWADDAEKRLPKQEKKRHGVEHQGQTIPVKEGGVWWWQSMFV